MLPLLQKKTCYLLVKSKSHTTVSNYIANQGSLVGTINPRPHKMKIATIIKDSSTNETQRKEDCHSLTRLKIVNMTSHRPQFITSLLRQRNPSFNIIITSQP